MSPSAQLLKKAFQAPELAQISFEVAVLERYLAQNDVKVSRTNSVGRIKASTWSLDFGISPNEKTIHVPLGQLTLKLPEKERTYWLDFVQGRQFSENFLKMLASHACIDDGNLRPWGEEASDSFF